MHMAQLMPLPLTVSCFSKMQIGFTFLVPADLGSPRKRAVKRVCVCALTQLRWTADQWASLSAQSFLHKSSIVSIALQVSAVADGPARPSIRGKCLYVLGHPNFKARKLAYYGHTVRKQGSCLEKEIMQGTMPGARRRGRPRTAWMGNIKTWTGQSVEESIR